MTLRELLEKLKAIDEKSLDMPVVITPAPPGEYAGFDSVSDVSVLHAGVTVLHLANDGSIEAENKTQLEEAHKLLWGANAATGDGPVAAVDPHDIRSVWNMVREVQAHAPAGQPGSISIQSYEHVCGPKADIHAVWYRVSMLQLLCGPMGLLSTRLHDGDPDDSVLKIAASIPMKRMVPGVQQGMPFDVDEFMKQVEQTATERHDEYPA